MSGRVFDKHTLLGCKTGEDDVDLSETVSILVLKRFFGSSLSGSRGRLRDGSGVTGLERGRQESKSP